MAPGDAFREICDWRRSRPLIFTQPSASHFQLVESLLNTHEAALEDFPLQDGPIGDRGWRYLIVAAAGSIHPPCQGPNGIGTSLHCLQGYAIFFIPVLKEDEFIRSCFGVADAHPNLDFSYLYEAPYRFASFVLSPGQTVIFPPGQVYAYASLSQESNSRFIPGCKIQCSHFLAAGCMKRSFFTSWFHRNSANQFKSEHSWDTTLTLSLMAMVWNAVCALSTAQEQPIHSPDIVNLFSLALMAMEFVGDREPRYSEMTKSLGRYCAEQGADSCSRFLNEFSRLNKLSA
ncbi:uncharacterized protein EI90DRAFT_3076250, partial [Cantharellus anzutake]|uniref:uncharacterized protein n=1 Tax=Cantharellus anzutake TaxID=1750568 RepID=UPI0019049C2D